MADQTSFNGLFSIAGKTALVTGATAGIGEMLARGLAEAGASVIICSRKADAVERVVAELEELGHCIGVAADLADPAGIEVLGATVEKHGDPLHLLINNAGATWGAPLEEYPDAAFDKVLALNVRSAFRLTVRLLPALRAAASPADPARVINIGSIEGTQVPTWENYAYPASKAALQMLTRQLAGRLASEAITVNTIAPGPFPSRMISFAQEDPAGWEDIERSIPLGRAGRPADVVGAAIYLASPAGAYITAATLPVDGGLAGVGTTNR